MARRTAFGKPHIVAEFGIGDPTAAKQEDPRGIYVHNGATAALAVVNLTSLAGCWAALAAASAGTAMTWWWDNYIDPDNLYAVFTGVAAVSKQIDFAQFSWTPLSPSFVSGGADHIAVGSESANGPMLLWYLRAVHFCLG